MSEPRECPCCGSRGFVGPAGDEFAVACEDVKCALSGPLGRDEGEAVDYWNALPRWPGWRPASDPPEEEVNPTRRRKVLGFRPVSRIVAEVEYSGGRWYDAANFVIGVSHWMPLPPGPEGDKP